MKELNSSLYKNKIKHPEETVYEIITAEDGLGWGLSIADINKSEKHIHEKTKEVYTVLEGSLKVVLGNKEHKLEKGETINIPKGVEHWAESLRDEKTRVSCISLPAWVPEDHKVKED